mgnify:CR=1 FL=1
MVELIPLLMLETVDFALLSLSLIVLLMLSHLEEAVELTVDHVELATLLIVLVAVLTADCAASILPPIVL